MMLAMWKRECLRAVAESVAVTCLMYCEKYRRIVQKKGWRFGYNRLSVYIFPLGENRETGKREILFPWLEFIRDKSILLLFNVNYLIYVKYLF